jgi:anti-sigma regulatory factor (Ser/Thr protein kinase)
MRSRLSTGDASSGLDMLERDLVSDPTAPGLARAMIGQMALSASMEERGRLLGSELVTNSVRHADAGMISVHMTRHSNGLDVTITDPGPGFAYAPVIQTDEMVGGRGLFLVDQIADAWSTGGVGDPSVTFRLDAPEMHRAEIATSSLTLSIGVSGYERDDPEGADANWLEGEVELELRDGPAAGFKACMAVAWTTRDIASFHDSLSALLSDATGTARLVTADDQVELTVELAKGSGTISGRAAQTAFEGVAIDQSQLAPAVSALARVVAAYPSRPAAA